MHAGCQHRGFHTVHTCLVPVIDTSIYLLQATLVLIQGLALEPLLELVASGKSISGSSHPFADVEARQKVHDVLGAWWHHANEAHAPVLMAWAVFAALAGAASEGAH